LAAGGRKKPEGKGEARDKPNREKVSGDRAEAEKA